MTKYTSYRPSSAETQSREERQKIHPVWRGIGLILMVIFPVMGYFASLWLLDENAKKNWVTIPSQFLASGADELIFVKIGMTVVIVFILYFLFQFFSFIIMRVFGQERYGPMDIPRESWKGPKRSR